MVKAERRFISILVSLNLTMQHLIYFCHHNFLDTPVKPLVGCLLWILKVGSVDGIEGSVLRQSNNLI